MDPNTITLVIQIGIPLLLLLLGWGFGRIAERRHYRSLHHREDLELGLPITNERRLMPQDREVLEVQLMRGSAVISVDYFKRFTAWLRGLFGGEVHSYSSLLDRARREAKLRMIEAWPEADLILNFRLETSTISNSSGNSLGTVEVLAYGTGVRFGNLIEPPKFKQAAAQPPVEAAMAASAAYELCS
jgi:uncharacterized protein YbjQ (UPF0145 family)